MMRFIHEIFRRHARNKQDDPEGQWVFPQSPKVGQFRALKIALIRSPNFDRYMATFHS